MHFDIPFEEWCVVLRRRRRGNKFHVLTERAEQRPDHLQTLAAVVRQHYDDPERFARRIARMGYERAAEIIRLRLPITPRARSGDLGEIFATEYARKQLRYFVPINRLQWKDGRNMPLRGDDLIGIKTEGSGIQELLKGESKSAQNLTARPISEAMGKLLEYDGRPSPHSLTFVSDRLHELGNNDIADMLEDYAVDGSDNVKICHGIFTLSSNAPAELFRDALDADYPDNIARYCVGVVVDQHRMFVAQVYEAADGPNR
jgi:Cap4 SAVED domain